MAVARELGRAGGTAGVEVGGDVGGRDVAAADEAIVGLACARSALKSATPSGSAAARAGGLVVRRHAQHGRQRRHLAAHAHRLRPDARLVVRAVGDQHLRAGRVISDASFSSLSSGFSGCTIAAASPPHSARWYSRQAGSSTATASLGPHAQRVQQVGGLVDAGQQLGVRPADRLVGRIAAAQERRAPSCRRRRAPSCGRSRRCCAPSAPVRAASPRAGGCRRGCGSETAARTRGRGLSSRVLRQSASVPA